MARSGDWLRSQRHQHAPAIDAELRWLEHDAHHFIPLDSASYPPLLAEVSDAPIGLFVRGDPAALSLPQLAIVGSRNPTAGGRDNATSFAAHLARSGLAITSGLAIGIDAAAHQGALAADGITVAVCGTGLDIDYPAANRALAEAIEQRGALVSEFPLGMPALQANFPRRNRIISGLALGTLVVEAARAQRLADHCPACRRARARGVRHSRFDPQPARARLSSADQARREARGNRRRHFRGAARARRRAGACAASRCSGSAKLGRRRAGTEQAAGPVLDKAYEILLDALGFEPAGVDMLVERTGFAADEVASMLLILELDGKLESRPGGRYVRRVLKAAK